MGTAAAKKKKKKKKVLGFHLSQRETQTRSQHKRANSFAAAG